MSQVLISELAFGKRLDPEFYEPQFTKIRAGLSRYRLLGDCLTDIRYGIQAEPNYVNDGIPYIRAMNLNNPWINGEILNISSDQIPKTEAGVLNTENLLRSGDILITRTGANCGAVGIVTEQFENATFGSYTIRLRTNECTNPFFLFAFLLTEAGRALTYHARYGSAQPNLSIPYLKNLVYVPPVNGTDRVEDLVRTAVATAHSETRLYFQAEKELLSQLGLAELEKESRMLCFSDLLSKLKAAGRSDAEVFHPHIRHIQETLAKQNRTIGDVAKLREEPFTPQPSKSFHYIEIGNLASNTAITGTRLDGDEAPSRAKYYVHANDVLTSTVRPLRRLSGLVAPDQDGWVCSSGLAVLKPEGVPPEYLVAYLRLRPVCEVMNAYTLASMYPAIQTSDILRIPFYMPDDKDQVERICKSVRIMHAARLEAEKKLAEAKQIVDDAVEHG